MMRVLLKTAFSNTKQAVGNLTKMDNFVWIDLEMTGLEVENHKILEAACVITTADLNPVHEGLRIVIHQPETVLKSMNYWSCVHHAKSGLTFESRESKISIEEADKILSDYIKLHSKSGGLRHLAGNSVYMDKRFLEKYMPISDGLLHYRLLDVSGLAILCKNWYPDEFSKLSKKKKGHRALDDIWESILQLKELQKVIFKGIDSSDIQLNICKSTIKSNKE